MWKKIAKFFKDHLRYQGKDLSGNKMKGVKLTFKWSDIFKKKSS